MAASINKAILVGNLGRDPDIKTTKSGSKIANLTLATGDTWTDKRTGEKQERTEWHRVVIFNERLADVAERFLHKGSKVYIEGELRTRKWTDQQGTERYTTSVVLQFNCALVLLDRKNSDEAQAQTSPKPKQKYQSGTSMSDAAGYDWGDNDDEIPF